MILRFNKSVYSQGALEKSTRAYKNLVKFSLKESKDYFELECKDWPKDGEILEKEFKNYVLMQTTIDERK